MFKQIVNDIEVPVINHLKMQISYYLPLVIVQLVDVFLCSQFLSSIARVRKAVAFMSTAPTTEFVIPGFTAAWDARMGSVSVKTIKLLSQFRKGK